jgi:serine/threonine protein kinase
MISGKPPFKGDYDQAIIYSILNEEPEPLKSMQPEIPNEIEFIINKALTKNQEERYRHISETSSVRLF